MAHRIIIDVDNITEENPPFTIDRGDLTELQLLAIVMNVILREGARATNTTPAALLIEMAKELV